MPASDKYWRPIKRMHVVFALSCLALLGATLLMMAADHDREWKPIQRTNEQIKSLRIQLDLHRAGALTPEQVETLAGKLTEEQRKKLGVATGGEQSEYLAEQASLEERIAAAEKSLAEKQESLDPIRGEIADLALAFDLASRKDREQKAVRDKARADFDLAVRDELPKPDRDRLFAAFEEQQAAVDANVIMVEEAKASLDEKQAELAAATKGRDDLQADLKKLRTDEELLRKARNDLDPESTIAWLKRKSMELPIIDGFNSHLRIRQDWLPELDITLGMSTTARFDRCRTCHLNAADVLAGGIPAFPAGHPESEDYRDWIAEGAFPQPYSTHPRTDVYLTATSPHPVTTFGCTVCHNGNGSGTSFQDAEHGPNEPSQEHHWEDEFGYHPNHFWEYPMNPKRFLESTCIKCHHDVTELAVNPEYGPTAPKVVEGRDLIGKLGCFGCHEIHGYDGDDRIGPDLRLEPNYAAAAEQVLADPYFANLATLLDAAPLDDMTEDELQDRVARVAELAGVRDLIGSVASEPEDTPDKRHALRNMLLADSKADEPRFSVRTHGLAAALEDVAHPGKYRKVGPSLRHIAEKTSRGWLEFWTEKPSRFRPSTRMPQFWDLSNQQDHLAEDLTPIEVAGIAQYLLDKSQPVELLAPTESYEPDPVRGAKAFSEKGCLSCHQIGAFPKGKQDFGPDLSRVHAKIKPGFRNEDGSFDVSSEGFRWLYTWIVEPQRHHPRSRMPNLYVNERATDDENPAADIAAFLLSNRSQLVLTEASPLVRFYEPDAVGELSDEAVTAIATSLRTTGEQVKERLKSLVEKAGDEAEYVDLGMGSFSAAESLADALDALDVDCEALGDPEEVLEVVGEVIGIDGEANPDAVRPYTEGLPKILRVYVDEEELTTAREDLEEIGLKLEVRYDEIAKEYNTAGYMTVDGGQLDDLVRIYLRKSLTKARTDAFMGSDPKAEGPRVAGSREYPFEADKIKGDEIEFAGPAAASDEEWRTRMLNYIGRKTISRYGCYACHDVPGFETARPIGTVLQDWGRKDTSKLATEHIHEYLKHHGEPDGSSTEEAVEAAIARGRADEFETPEEAEEALRPAFFYESLMHHGRAGFLWQKLRAPRSYDFEKIETKGFDERLKMPKFPVDGEEIEAIATFVLGLVAEPPPAEYVYQPDARAADRIEGEWLLEKYNCIGCHVTEMPEITLAVNPEPGEDDEPNFTTFDSVDAVTSAEDADFFAHSFDKLLELRPIRKAYAGETADGKAIIRFHGMLDSAESDPTEDLGDRLFNARYFSTWENIDVGRPGSTKLVTLNSPKIAVSTADVLDVGEGRGGGFAHHLVELAVGNPYDPSKVADVKNAWQTAPPPLIGEGAKVQTQWLYRFLRNPGRLRRMTVLRMPQFNMSQAEARTLANYFAAKDGVPYPYQNLEPKDPGYLAARSRQFSAEAGMEVDYLKESWELLHNTTVQCYKCHQVGAMKFTAPRGPKDVRGPDLWGVNDRLRPEWLEVWLSKPAWLLPYTSMPVNYPKPKPGEPPKVPDVLGGHVDEQIEALRDVLLNYHDAVDEYGKIEVAPPMATDDANPAEGDQ